MSVEDVLRSLGWALGGRLFGEFDLELKRWSKAAGIEMLGTEALEAGRLEEIVGELLRDPKVLHDVTVGLAEIGANRV